MRSVTYPVPGLVVTDHTLDVPLVHAEPMGEHLEVFAREVVAAGREKDGLPALLYLQGGPGFEAPRPVGVDSSPWLARALKEFRVVLLDQRGVGRSTPVGPADVATHGAAGLASRLVHYRADAIVRDAELLRRALGIEKWTVLGQSFGGFCVVSYLSLHPESLSAALVTGGLPPLVRPIDDVYRATYRTAASKSRAHYARYPQDQAVVAATVERLLAEDVRLPGGDRLTAERFRQVGHMIGMGSGSDRLHHILEMPFGSPAFLHDVEASASFGRNPLYAVVHESCYAPDQVTDWAADRLRPPEFDQDVTLMTGEHIGRWMFSDYGGLVPFAETAELLAAHAWGPLYDPARLADNEVPVAACVYAQDMYVEREFSEETASRIRGLRMWLTNEFEHDGLSAGGERVLDRLLAMARGQV